MKKTIALLLCLCMLACLFVGCASTSTTEQQTSETTTTTTTTTETATSESGNKVLKIGIFEPLTGDNGAGGKPGDAWPAVRQLCPADHRNRRRDLRHPA